MKKMVLLFAMALSVLFVTAQPTPGSSLTIFSEDGSKFYLYLNGEQQNNKPQTNIRVEDLTQAYYSCKIVFEDTQLGELTKGTLMIKDMDGQVQEVVYRIKTDKNNGKKTLKYYSAEPVQPDYKPASNVVVYHYGNPVAVGVTETTTTTTVGTGTNTNMSVNVDGIGIGVNVNVNDPLYTETTTTTTTTHTNSGPGRNDNYEPRNNTYGDCGYQYSMKSADFEEAKTTIKNASFEDTKLATAKEIITSNCLKADQIVQVCNLFSFEDSKLEFAKFAYTHTIDRSNFFKVNNVFTFSSSKEELSNYIRTVK